VALANFFYRYVATARITDILLPVYSGTDALLMKAMIANILQQNRVNRSYLENHVEGYAGIEPWFSGMDVESAISVCRLDFQQEVEPWCVC
jgi:anaerobic selenocysteine-containing dehydrogenase